MGKKEPAEMQKKVSYSKKAFYHCGRRLMLFQYKRRFTVALVFLLKGQRKAQSFAGEQGGHLPLLKQCVYAYQDNQR